MIVNVWKNWKFVLEVEFFWKNKLVMLIIFKMVVFLILIINLFFVVGKIFCKICGIIIFFIVWLWVILMVCVVLNCFLFIVKIFLWMIFVM